MITASIVLYNTDIHELQVAIDSFKPSHDHFLYLIDNSEQATDLSRLNIDFDYVTYIFNNKNIGYGAAHNIALRESTKYNSKYHIILNPDVTFDLKILERLECFMNENIDVVYLLPKVLYPNGEIQYLCKLLPTPIGLFLRRFLSFFPFSQKQNDKYVLKQSGYNKIFNPPCLSGCFMFLRMSTIKDNSLFFDERFFMYFEDFDLIRRLHRVGKTIFYPYVTIIHNHARDSYHSKKMLKIHIISAIKYFNKWGWFSDNERTEMNKKVLDDLNYK